MTPLLAITLDIAGKASGQQVPGSAGLTSADAGFGKLVGGLLSFVLLIGVVLVFLNIIVGSIDWISSGGDKGKVEAARTKITTAIIGLIVLASSTAILSLVQRFLGICFLNFGGKC
jgi:uncharacterized membrane protein HdeD (DUF308 family)